MTYHFEDILYVFICSVPLYYFWRWLYGKFIGDKTKRQITIFGSTVISAPLMFRGLIMLFLFCLFYYPKIDFDRTKWITEPGKRYQMTESMIESKMLVGKTKEEVINLLGGGQGFGTGDTAAYNIGISAGGLGIDPDMLEIQFKNGKVIKVSQLKD
jgi:uncharacterized membrane-anchored protein YitT (DUF2179 family)